MKRDRLRSTLSWMLVVVNLIAGVVWVLLAFGWLTGQEGVNLLYLAIGVACFVASAAWLFSIRRLSVWPRSRSPHVAADPQEGPPSAPDSPHQPNIGQRDSAETLGGGDAQLHSNP